MNILLSVSVFLLFADSLVADESWLGATVVSSSMSKAMEDEAIFTAHAKMTKPSAWVGTADLITKHFEATYGGSWNCIIQPQSDARDIAYKYIVNVVFKFKTFYIILWQSR
ncbi:hypothetical protein HDE_11706 [Halotydeus destructor]|nr:hypothetical protein HDE_11706 [Halotydeus destructor]